MVAFNIANNFEYLNLNKEVVTNIPESFNTNISHQLVDYIITVVNLQHKNTNLNGDLYSKPVLNIRFKVFWYTKKELKVEKPLYIQHEFLTINNH